MWYTDGKVIGSDEGTKLGISDVKVIGNILGNVYGITLGINVGTELRSLDGSFYCYNDFMIERLLLVYSLGSTYGKMIDSN